MTEAQVSEAILALASAVSGKDLTSEGDGTKATAITVLSDALGDPETDADTALYDAAQLATRRSTDTEEAAKSVLALSSGGGAQSYPITVNVTGGTVHFYTDSGEELTTEAPAGTPMILLPKTSSGVTPTSGSINVWATQGDNTPSFIDTTDFSRDYAVAMPIGGLTVDVTIRG